MPKFTQANAGDNARKAAEVLKARYGIEYFRELARKSNAARKAKREAAAIVAKQIG